MEHDRNTADHLYNVDHPEVLARREDVGLTGAVMQSVCDIAICLDGLPIDSTYGHAGGAVVQHAPFALAGYWTVARRRDYALSRLPGTGQSDYFLTYLGCMTKQQQPTAAGLRLNADLTVVVLNPGWGDAIQASKAGLMEIADLFVINKAERPGLAATRRDLNALIALRPPQRRPAVVETVACEGRGIA